MASQACPIRLNVPTRHKSAHKIPHNVINNEEALEKKDFQRFFS